MVTLTQLDPLTFRHNVSLNLARSTDDFYLISYSLVETGCHLIHASNNCRFITIKTKSAKLYHHKKFVRFLNVMKYSVFLSMYVYVHIEFMPCLWTNLRGCVVISSSTGGIRTATDMLNIVEISYSSDIIRNSSSRTSSQRFEPKNRSYRLQPNKGLDYLKLINIIWGFWICLDYKFIYWLHWL